jgi:hypothetical protein
LMPSNRSIRLSSGREASIGLEWIEHDTALVYSGREIAAAGGLTPLTITAA